MDDKVSIIEAFYKFAQAEQKREAEELIKSENLNDEAAKRYLEASLRIQTNSEAIYLTQGKLVHQW